MASSLVLEGKDAEEKKQAPRGCPFAGSTGGAAQSQAALCPYPHATIDATADPTADVIIPAPIIAAPQAPMEHDQLSNTFVNTFRESLRLIARQSRLLVGAHQSAVSFVPDGDFASGIHTHSFSSKYERYNAYDVMPTGCGIWSIVVHDNIAMRMTQEELVAHPRWRNFSDLRTRGGLEHPPMRGWLAIPVRDHTTGDVIGVIQLSDKYDGEFTDHDEQTMLMFSQMVALTFELHCSKEALAKAEKQAIAAAQQQVRAHEAFFSQFSHEIRNPLHGMRATLEHALGTRGITDAGLMDDLQVLNLCCNSLYTFVNEVIDRGCSRNSDGIVVMPTDCSPAAIARDVTILYSHMSTVPLHRHVAPDVPARVCVDAGRVRQIVTNAVTNAIKHTSRGHIDVNVSFKRAEGDPERGELTFAVQDTGNGLGGQDPETLFADYTMGEPRTERSGRVVASTGLGLSLCRAIATAMDGSVSLRDTGSGCVMTAVFPVQVLHVSASASRVPSFRDEDEQPTKRPSADRIFEADGEPESPSEITDSTTAVVPAASVRIVIADDEIVNAKILRKMLNRLGVTDIVCVQDGSAVLGALCPTDSTNLAILPDQHRTVLLLDVIMTDMHGDAACAQLRSMGWHGAICACTGNASTADMERYLATGFNAVLPKPFSIHDLRRFLTTHCHIQVEG